MQFCLLFIADGLSVDLLDMMYGRHQKKNKNVYATRKKAKPVYSYDNV